MTRHRTLDVSLLGPELVFTTSRSSGPGGQNVNKVNSKVTLRFDIPNSKILNDEEREILLQKLATRLTRDGVLVMSAQDKRSQFQNKEEVALKFGILMSKAFERKKTRKATKPSKASVHRRIEGKKRHAEKKKRRAADGMD